MTFHVWSRAQAPRLLWRTTWGNSTSASPHSPAAVPPITFPNSARPILPASASRLRPLTARSTRSAMPTSPCRYRAVYRSEHATGHRNRAIANMMLNTSMLERDPNEVLDLYFRQCSVKVTARDLAIMAATLANHGRNPITGEIVYGAQSVRDVLTVMNSCGMYNYAGQWSYEVGMPAKSGVSGCILAVIPGQIGIGVYSPSIDALGNSVRGIRVCEEISKEFDLHVFNNRTNVCNAIRREYRGDAVRSNRLRMPAER